MRIILLGAPGGGKGTQGDLISKRYGFPRISTGDLLRQAVEKGTPLGRKAEAFMKEGQLVNDEIVTGLVRERIADPDCRQGYILDGFPRTIAQAEAIKEMDGKRREIVIGIEVSPAILIDRLSGRRVCSSCRAVYNLSVLPSRRGDVCDVCGGRLVQRADDTCEVIRKRIEVYHEETEKLKDYYLRKKVYRPVDGERAVDEVFLEIARVIDAEIGQGAECRSQR